MLRVVLLQLATTIVAGLIAGSSSSSYKRITRRGHIVDACIEAEKDIAATCRISQAGTLAEKSILEASCISLSRALTEKGIVETGCIQQTGSRAKE